MKKTRRLAVSVLVCLSIAAAALTASAAAPIKVYRDGTEVVTEAAPHFVEGQVMIPLSLAGELFDHKISYDDKTRVLNVNARSGLIAKSEDGKFSVTGTEDPGGMWDDLHLNSGENGAYLPGRTLGPDSNYPPEFASANLTGGSEPDLVVLLTQGYGTGVYINEAVVYDADLRQVPLEEARVAMLKQFRSSVLPDGSVKVEAGGTETVIAEERLLTEKKNRDGAPGIWNVLRYEMEGGRLTATAGVQLGTSEFIGDLKIEYTYKNGVLQAGTAVFAPYDEYR
ncbi:hypothetical protein [Saccharibacillus alkalitolerans]|uniref:Copper amine oxidase-like N-terminal domain-containing protein n=1 Tax=Saccharibacillus alkalitolerans TaxID=2705290 RepID=A0ABX0F5N7_9BACL|nr:hypothetical protein [Saccharibacillus alkalitolerans]NGZ76261.1 hypothetical protein [Saccharibacillus alkalitolerans]